MIDNTFYDRLLIEKQGLVSRHMTLSTFIGSDRFEVLDKIDKHLLKLQFKAMDEYLSVLRERIKRVEDKFNEGN